MQLAKEQQVFAGRQPRIETVVCARMIAQTAADVARLADGIMACNARVPPGWNQEGSEDAKERGFSRAIRAKNGERFAFVDFE